MSKLVKDNLADFGGVFPVDPDKTTLIGPSCSFTNGQYGFIRFDGGLKYTAGVYAEVENKSNANIKCGSIVKNADPVLGPLAAGDAAPYCYLAVVQ